YLRWVLSHSFFQNEMGMAIVTKQLSTLKTQARNFTDVFLVVIFVILKTFSSGCNSDFATKFPVIRIRYEWNVTWIVQREYPTYLALCFRETFCRFYSTFR